MCCDDKFLFFINMRLCSLIFGWIAVVITGILTLVCFIIDVILIVQLIQSYGNIVPIVIVTWILVNIATGFTATVFLLIGILKNKPAILKGYIIYGMVHMSLFVIQQIVVEVMNLLYFPFKVIITVGIVIYICILCALYKTYKSMVIPPQIFYNPPQQVQIA